jgi:glutamate-1-semialdehyde aminotransferase
MGLEASTGFTVNKIGTTYANRADMCIAGGALTNSKRPESHVKGVYPTHLTRGSGAFVYDERGGSYLDYIIGLGSTLLGYGQNRVNEAIAGELANGYSLSLSSTLEIECAELIKSVFPMIEKLRILKTGSDATMAAIRFARAYNGRSVVLSEGYHGHSDGFVSMTPPAAGVMDSFQYFDLNKYDITENVSCVIVEPIITDFSQARIEWLKQLRDKCTKAGVILIFDEVITGMRVPGYSVARNIGVDPDIICLGKAIANGMPLSVVGGKKEIMDNQDVFISSTYAGERLSLAACMASIQEIKRLGVQSLWDSGNYFLERFNGLSKRVQISGYCSRGVFQGETLDKALFFQECVRSGILFGPSWFYSFPLMKHDHGTLSVCRDVIGKIESGNVKLMGDLPKSPFAQKVREGVKT